MRRIHVAERRSVSDLRQTVIEGLGSSSRYRHLTTGLLARTADWAVARHAKPGPALKAAKRKLHQVFGAYAVKLDSLESHLDALETGDETHAVCRRILKLHHSTAERLSFMEIFHATIWNHCGTPRHVVDLAAGLNAFSLPFSGLDSTVSYTAIEIDRRMVDAVRRFLAFTQRPGGCLWHDILDGIPCGGRGCCPDPQDPALSRTPETRSCRRSHASPRGRPRHRRELSGAIARWRQKEHAADLPRPGTVPGGRLRTRHHLSRSQPGDRRRAVASLIPCSLPVILHNERRAI